MAYTSTYPPTFPVQASRARGQVSAEPFDLDGLTGARRTATCANSLLANHCGALAADAYIDPANGALTTDLRSLTYVFSAPWLLDLDTAQSLVDVWIWVVRPSNANLWEINIITSAANLFGQEVNNGATTAGAWWHATTIAIDDTSQVEAVRLVVNTFTEAAPAAHIGAVMILPTPINTFNSATVLENMGRKMTPIDLQMIESESAASTLLLQWQASIMEKVARRGGMAASGAQLQGSGLGVTADVTVIVLDAVPDDCVTCTFHAQVSFFNGAGVSKIIVGDAGEIIILNIGLKSLQFAVEPGVERVLVIECLNVTIQSISVSYDEAP